MHGTLPPARKVRRVSLWLQAANERDHEEHERLKEEHEKLKRDAQRNAQRR